MAAPIRKAVIAKIAKAKRVSLAVASHIYACKPIRIKDRLCQREAALQSAQESSK